MENFKAPKHGYLGAWADQGVLLLNAALTVRAEKANSHAKRGWETFTERVIEAVDKCVAPSIIVVSFAPLPTFFVGHSLTFELTSPSTHLSVP